MKWLERWQSDFAIGWRTKCKTCLVNSVVCFQQVRGFGNRNPKGLNKVLLRKMAIWRFTIRKDSIKEVRGRETCILVKGLF